MSTPPLSYAAPPIPVSAATLHDRPVDGQSPFGDIRSRFFAGASDPGARATLAERFPAHCAEIIAAHDTSPDGPRQQSLVRLAQAFALSGDAQYADPCLNAIEQWASGDGNRRPGSQEAGFRLISWCWSLVLLHPSATLTPQRLGTIAASVRSEAASLSVMETQSQATTSTSVLVDALALLYVATLFPEFGESRRWRDLAFRVLVAECQRQVHSDGVHFEQATCFQRYAIDVYLHFLLLAARHRIDVPPFVGETLQRMLEFVLAVRMPDGTVPSLGDSDGGSLLPLAIRSTADPRGRFAIAAALFSRSDFAWAAGGAAPELAWLMGAEGIRAFDALRPTAPATSPSRAFPSGGYAVMRSGWQRDAHHMVVDVGQIGCPINAAHGHADLLSIQCSVFGQPVIVDPGTHCYDDSRWRDYFRSTAAHSTVLIDGLSQAEPAGSFAWHRRPRVRLREWHSTADVDFLDAEHDGYATLPFPVVHRRRVIFIKPRESGQPSYWIVVDDLDGSGRHTIDVRFQLTSDHVSLGPHPWARAATPGGECLWISAFPSAPAQTALKCGDASPICGWISPEFTRLSPAPMLIYTFAVALPWRIVTLLFPDRQGLSMPPGVRPVYDAGGLPHGFMFERPRRLVRFDDRAVLVERD